MIDLHLHSKFDKDGEGSIGEYCDLASKFKFNEIGFIKHTLVIDRFAWTIDSRILENFFSEVENARRRWDLKIRIGAEMDYFEGKEEEIEKLARKFDFDYILCSVHFLRGYMISDPSNYEFKKCFEDRSYWEIVKEYFLNLRKALESDLFDGIAHFDYIRRTTSIFYGKELNLDENTEVKQIVNEILELIRKKNLVVELNTSSIRHGLKQFYPNNQILRICKDKNLKITIGSDSHSPKHFGIGVKGAFDLLRELKFKEIYSFSKRRKIRIKIPQHDF